MKRRYQIFKADIPQGKSLELVPSPWHNGLEVSIPLEHWDVLQELAAQRGHVRPELWNTMGQLEGQGCEAMESRMFCTGLKLLQRELRHDMVLMLTRTSTFPEPLPGSEHARMLEAVIRVLEMSGSKADSWIE